MRPIILNLAIALTALMLMAMGPMPIQSSRHKPNLNSDGQSDVHLTAAELQKADRRGWGTRPIFSRLIEKHDRYQQVFEQWRKLVAIHAATLAGMVTSLPIAADLNKNTILKIFSQSTGCGDSLDYQDIFAAWENRWSGTWSNGVPQYHCWYSSSQFNDRWIQPVTISEFDFIELCYTETMINKGKADIAINVYCPKDGISGWVSKRQHGGLEIPHIGYRIDDTTLIWICQIKEPAKLFERGEEWLIFLERVNRTSQPHKYQIYGKCVTMNKHICREKDNNTAHAGNYYAIHN